MTPTTPNRELRIVALGLDPDLSSTPVIVPPRTEVELRGRIPHVASDLHVVPSRPEDYAGPSPRLTLVRVFFYAPAGRAGQAGRRRPATPSEFPAEAWDDRVSICEDLEHRIEHQTNEDDASRGPGEPGAVAVLSGRTTVPGTMIGVVVRNDADDPAEVAVSVAYTSRGRPPLHRPRVGRWPAGELRAHLAGIVDALAEDGTCSAIDVLLELLGGELETFALFGRLGHLDPPQPDGKIRWAILQRPNPDPAIQEKLRETVGDWLAEHALAERSQATDTPGTTPVRGHDHDLVVPPCSGVEIRFHEPDDEHPERYPFQALLVDVPDDVAPHFKIDEIRVAGRSIAGYSAGDLVDLERDATGSVTVLVWNTSSQPRNFRAVLWRKFRDRGLSADTVGWDGDAGFRDFATWLGGGRSGDAGIDDDRLLA